MGAIEQRANSVFRSQFWRRRLNNRHQNTAFFKHLEGAFLSVTTDRVEDHIYIARHVLKPRLVIIDRFIHPQFAQKRLVLRRSGSDDIGAYYFPELHGEIANTAGRAVDQYLLTCP